MGKTWSDDNDSIDVSISYLGKFHAGAQTTVRELRVWTNNSTRMNFKQGTII